MDKVTARIWPVVVLGAVLRLVGLARLDLWYDEIFTAWLANLPTGAMLAATAGDVHPPGWYLLTAVFVQFLGSSEWVIRLPAALFGVANVWLTWKVASAWGAGRRAAWLSALIMAVLPCQVYYSQEGRMYQALLCGVLLMALAVQRRSGLLFALGGLLAVWMQTLGAVHVAALALAGVVIWRARDLRWLVLALAAICIGWAPWLVALLGQVSHIGAGFWVPRVTLGSWLYSWVFLLWGPVLGPEAALLGIVAAFALVTMAAAWGIKRRAWGLLSWLFVPGACLLAASWLWRPVFLDRALIGVVPALAILVAWLVVKSPSARLVAAVALPVFVAGWIGLYFGTAKLPITDYTTLIREQWREGDLVFHGNLATYLCFAWYAPDLDQVVWPGAGDLSQNLTFDTQEAMGIRRSTVDLADVPGRIWIVWSDNPMTSSGERALIEGMIDAWGGQEIEVISDNELLHAGIWIMEGDQWLSSR